MTYPITCSCLRSVGAFQLDAQKLADLFVEMYPHLLPVVYNLASYGWNSSEGERLRRAYIRVSNRYAFQQQDGEHNPQAYREFLRAVRKVRLGRGRCGHCGMAMFRLLDIPKSNLQESTQARA